MARRRVAVELDLEARGYLGTAAQVAVATRAMDSAIDDVGDEADATGRDLKTMAANADVAARRADHLGDEARQAAVSVAALDRQIDRVGRRRRLDAVTDDTRGLRSEIDKTRESIRGLHLRIGATGGDDSMFGDLRRQETHLRRLMRTRKALTPNVGKVGQLFGDELPPLDFSKLVAESRGILIAGVVGIVVASLPVMVPMLAAGIAGAVVGAAGVGGIAGGIVAAASDARVKDEWNNFVGTLTAEDFGRDLFINPTRMAIRELRTALNDMDIGEALKPLAPLVPVLAKGIGDFGRQFMPGFATAMQKAGPFLHVFADELGETGQALGDMLRTMANDPGAVSGLHAIMDGLEGLIRWLGGATNAAAVWWRGMTDIGVAATDWQLKYLGFLDVLPGVKMEDWNKHWHEWQDAATGAANATDTVNVRLSAFEGYLAEAADHAGDLVVRLQELFAAQMGLDQATLRWNQDLLRLRDAFATNGKTLAENTEAGLDNRQMVLTMIQDAIAVRDAVMEETGSQERANQVYQDKIAYLEQLLRKLGLTKAQIDALVGEYHIAFVVTTTGLIPKGVSFNPGAMSFAAGEAATMTLPTGPRYESTGPVSPVSVRGSVSDVYGAGGGKAFPTPYGYPAATDPRLYGQETGPGTRILYPGEFQGRQHGGPVRAHRSYWVGERGPEILSMGDYSGYVASRAMVTGGVAPSGGGGTVYHVVRLEWPDGRLIREFAITDAAARGITQSTIEVAYP